MKHVKLTEDVGRRRKGEVLEVDENSAKNLVEKRKVATYFDPATDKVDAERSAPRLGATVVQQVAEADIPGAVAGQPAEGESGDVGQVVDGAGTVHTGEIPPQDPPSPNDPKPELVARLVAASAATTDPFTAERAELMNRHEIVDKLNEIAAATP